MLCCFLYLDTEDRHASEECLEKFEEFFLRDIHIHHQLSSRIKPTLIHNILPSHLLKPVLPEVTLGSTHKTSTQRVHRFGLTGHRDIYWCEHVQIPGREVVAWVQSINHYPNQEGVSVEIGGNQ